MSHPISDLIQFGIEVILIALCFEVLIVFLIALGVGIFQVQPELDDLKLKFSHLVFIERAIREQVIFVLEIHAHDCQERHHLIQQVDLLINSRLLRHLLSYSF